jgi:hypothetical protein
MRAFEQLVSELSGCRAMGPRPSVKFDLAKEEKRTARRRF